MSPPADLTPLRALVEAVTAFLEAGVTKVPIPYVPAALAKEYTRIIDALPAAQEALEYAEEIQLKDRGKTNEINILTRENREQAARLGRLEGIHREVVKRIRDEADPDAGRPWLVDQVLTILEGEPMGHVEGCEVCGHRKGALQTGPRNPWQIKLAAAEARLAELDGALAQILPYAEHSFSCPGATSAFTQGILNAVLQARDALKPQSTRDTTEWQRVHGPVIQGDAAVTSEAGAQAARDLAHWRTRAEHAEELCEKQMARVTWLEVALAKEERGCTECWKGASCGPDCRMNDFVEGRDE